MPTVVSHAGRASPARCLHVVYTYALSHGACTSTPCVLLVCCSSGSETTSNVGIISAGTILRKKEDSANRLVYGRYSVPGVVTAPNVNLGATPFYGATPYRTRRNLWRSYEHYDFRPTPGGPLIDAGVMPSLWPDWSTFANMTFIGDAPDIGARHAPAARRAGRSRDVYRSPTMATTAAAPPLRRCLRARRHVLLDPWPPVRAGGDAGAASGQRGRAAGPAPHVAPGEERHEPPGVRRGGAAR